jgi:predicted secreted Zn-dependent protease
MSVRKMVAPFSVIAAIVATVLVFALPASAAPAPPQVLGRKLVLYAHNGNPEEGAVDASAQGQLVDTNGNGLLDSLQARGALLEARKVIAVRIYDITLRRSVGGVWQTASQNLADAVSSAEPAYAVSTTVPIRLCASNPSLTRTYSVIHHDAIRWSNNVVGFRTTTSFNFTARALSNDPDCP